ncbi:MAG: ABC transporter substrate-binding protein [Acidimicrobiales bacterium]
MMFALAFVAAACGSSGSDSSEGSATTAAGEDGTTTTLDQEDTAITEPPAEAAGPVVGGTLIVGLEAEAPGLRPWEDTFSAPSYNVGVAIYDKLMEQTLAGDYVGWAAESIEANETLDVWTMTLRDGMKFTNGTEITGQTIADMFVVQQTGATSAGQVASSSLVDVTAEGNVVTYTLSKANAAFPSILSRAPLGMIFDPAVATADPEGYANNPIGSGPFMVETRDIDNETVLVRNPDYWMTDKDGTQLPYLDSIVFRPIPDENTRLDALTSGTVNAFQTLRQGTIRNARDVGDSIKVLEFQGSNTGGGMFNVAVAPYDDLRVRMGLTMNNSQEAVISALGGDGISAPAKEWFSVDSPWYSQAAADVYPKFDQAAGTALLQEYVDDPARSDGKAAGEPITVDLSCPPDPTLIAAMQVLEQLWTATGLVEVNLTNFDQQTHIGIALGEAPDYIGTHGAHCWRVSDDNDPSTTLNAAFAPVDASPLNWTNFFDEEMYGWIVEASSTTDFQTRYDLYEKVNIRLNEQVPMWYSGATATAIATDPNVNGIDAWFTPGGDLGVGFPSAEGRWGQVYIAAE